MSSEGPYGRQGFQANPGAGYGGGATYNSASYASSSYGQPPQGGSYSYHAPPNYGYGAPTTDAPGYPVSD
jgi:hypothetical protein